MNTTLFDEITQVMQEADCIHDATAVHLALQNMADAIEADLGDKVPLVIGVMNGAMVPLSLLLTKLNFPLKMVLSFLISSNRPFIEREISVLASKSMAFMRTCP